MTYLLFATALSLSAVAAYYSIMGLVAIFAAAAIPIFIMGSLLEVSKLVVASWLYRSWKQIPVLMKSYFTVALVILMMLTSMGIFGFLSKAHLDQAVPTGDISAKLALIDEKIKTEKENLNANRAELNQLDSQVNETISRSANSGSSTNAGTSSGGTSGIERSIAIRKAQQKDRQRILSEIGTTQARIAKLQEERAPIASEVRKVEAEVGPIKYIAAIIYGDSADQNLLESAVRIVIMMIVVVFDPLAVLMLVAANWQLRHATGEQEPLYIKHIQEVTRNVLVKEIDDEVKVEDSVAETERNTEVPPDNKLELRLEDEVSIENQFSVDIQQSAADPSRNQKNLGRYLSEIQSEVGDLQS